MREEEKMPKGVIFCNPYSDQLGEINFELTNIYSSGGPEFPALSIRTDITLRAYQQYGQNPPVVQPLSLISGEVQLSSPEHRPVAHSRRQDIALFAKDPRQHTSTQQTFTFPVDSKMLANIEEVRAGNDVRVDLTFQFLMGLHHHQGPLIYFQTGRAQIVFAIPRSQWVDLLLPRLGYEGLELIEVKYGTPLARQHLPNVVAQIQQAQKHILEGRWQEAVLDCRQALELTFAVRPSTPGSPRKFEDRVNDFIRDHLRLDAAQAGLLAEQMMLIWRIASQAAHPTPIVFSRNDAEFIAHSTIAVIGYVSKSLI
jgi:hypothetical protein